MDMNLLIAIALITSLFISVFALGVIIRYKIAQPKEVLRQKIEWLEEEYAEIEQALSFRDSRKKDMNQHLLMLGLKSEEGAQARMHQIEFLLKRPPLREARER